MKIFYNCCKTGLNHKQPVHWLQSNYEPELQKKNIKKIFEKDRIIFKLLALYFQKQNRVSKQVRQTIIDITWATILKKTLLIKYGLK